MSKIVKQDTVEPKGSGKDGDKGMAVTASTNGIQQSTEDVRKKLDKATMDADEDMDVSKPREYCNAMENHCDAILMANKQSKDASVGIPLLAIIVQCPEHADKVDGKLNASCFHILGKDISRKSVKEIKAYIDEKVELTGCGFLGCTVTLGEALDSDLEMMQIHCYSCPDNTLVDITEGCRIHEETKATYLALVVAMKFSKWYYNLMVNNTTLPFIKLEGDTAQYYPAPLQQNVSYSLWECSKNLTEYLRTGTSLEFKDLVETLMDSDKAS